MKKSIVLLIIVFAFNMKVNALERKEVELVNCTSLSNIWVKENNEIKRIYLSSFESASGKLDGEINSYFCNTLKETEKLEIVSDNSIHDKYNRDPVYLYVNGKSMEEDLIKRGYGQVSNIIQISETSAHLCTIQKQAIKESIGIRNYPNIKETYCDSGININNEIKNLEIEKNSFDNNYIKYISLIESGILLLLVLMKRE